MEAAQIAKKYLRSTKLLEMDIRPGDTVRVHERVKEGSRERIAVFEGLVISRRHGREPGATVTVRKITKGIGTERVFPLAMPTIEKIEIVRRAKVRRAKLNYIRDLVGKRATLKGELLPPGFGQPKDQEDEATAKVEEGESGESGTPEEPKQESKKDVSGEKADNKAEKGEGGD